MSDGGAQFKSLFLGSSFAGFTVDFYEAGLSTPKDAWLDENKSSTVQQVSADSRGMATWFADGDYRLIVKDASGTVLWDWPYYKMTSDTSTLWEGNQGTSYPSTSSKNRWQLFAKHTAGNAFSELGINDGTSFKKLLSKSSDDSANVFDDLMTKSPWADVRHPDFGAVGDGVTDDTTAIQAAIDSLTSGGTILLPQGTYLISSALTVSVSALTIIGVGIDATTIKTNSTTEDIFTIGDGITEVNRIQKFKTLH